ncbi:MAG: tetratricopeptide repeat protein [Nitrososphaera sp.]|nr:tetratricopeptide repeat protein [Nitrososphaera sp.]
MNTGRLPDPQFVENITAGLRYWQEQTDQLDDWAISELDAQRQNLHRMVRYGLVLPQTWRDTVVVILQSFTLVEQRGYWSEWSMVLERALSICPQGELHLRFKLLIRLGQLQRFMRQFSQAIETHYTAETVAQQLGDSQAVAEAHYNLSECYWHSRDYDKAEHYGLLALEHFNQLDAELKWHAAVLNTLGMVAWWRGDLPLAEQRLAKAVDYCRVIGQPTQQARTLNNLAGTLRAAEKYETALQYLDEAREQLASTASELDKAMVNITRGGIYYDLQQWAKAETAFRQANSTFLVRSGHIFYQALVAQGLGNVLLKQGQLIEAEGYLREGLILWQQANDNLMLSNTLGTLAETLAAQGRSVEAIALYDEALIYLARYPDDTWAKKLHTEFEIQKQALIEKEEPGDSFHRWE